MCPSVGIIISLLALISLLKDCGTFGVGEGMDFVYLVY